MQVTGIMLPSGETLPADLCVFGVGKCCTFFGVSDMVSPCIGVVPATDFLQSSGLPLTKRKEVIVNEVIRNSVYATS